MQLSQSSLESTHRADSLHDLGRKYATSNSSIPPSLTVTCRLAAQGLGSAPAPNDPLADSDVVLKSSNVLESDSSPYVEDSDPDLDSS